MLRRCVLSRNIKNGCSIYIYIYIYIYDISRLRVNGGYIDNPYFANRSNIQTHTGETCKVFELMADGTDNSL